MLGYGDFFSAFIHGFNQAKLKAENNLVKLTAHEINRLWYNTLRKFEMDTLADFTFQFETRINPL
jgi:hypothetical protein